MFISPFRRLTSVGTLATLTLLIFALWYITNPKRMGRLAETLLSSVAGGRVTVRYAHLSLNGTLLLSGVELHTDDAARPGGGDGVHPQPAFFSADQIEARFDWVSLFSGQLRATQLTAIRPTLALIEDTDTEQWNYEHLRNPQNVGGEARLESRAQAPALPVILIRDACVMFAEVKGGEVRETSETFVDGQLTPEASTPGVYRFSITQHGQAEGGAEARAQNRLPGSVLPGASSILPAATLTQAITGSWDVFNNRFDAETGRILLSDSLKRSLPRAVRRAWEEHGLKGALSELRVSFDNDDGLVLALSLDHVALTQPVQPRPSEGAGLPETFEVPVTDVTGDVTFGITRPSLHFAKLSGKILSFQFQADGDFRGGSAESPFDFKIAFNNAFLRHDYPALFIASPLMQNLLERTGAWGNFDLAVSARRLSWNGRVFFNGQITCRDAHLRFCHFPYPLDHLRGHILFDNDNVTFKDVTAKGEENDVRIAGTAGTSPANPAIDLTVSSDNTTFDDRVGACLPEKFRPLWDRFSLRAHGGFVCQVKRLRSAGSHAEPALTLDVTIDDGEGYMKSLPYRFTGAKGHLVFAAMATTIDHMLLHTGEDASGTVLLDGVVKQSGEDVLDLRPELQVKADVPVDEALLKALPGQLAEKLSGMTLAGRLGFDGTVRRPDSPLLSSLTGEAAIPQVDGEITLARGVFKMKNGELTLLDAAAAAHISGAMLNVHSLTAMTPGGLHLAATGAMNLAARSGSVDVSAHARGLTLPQSAPALLPEKLRTFWSTYQPAGIVDLTASATVMFPAVAAETAIAPASEPAPAPFQLVKPALHLSARGLTLASASWPEPVKDISGTLTLAGDDLTLDKLHADSGALTFDGGASGHLKRGSWRVEGTVAAGAAPDKWLAKLPPHFAGFLNAAKPAGQFKLTLARLERPGADKPWQFQGTLSARNLRSAGALALGAQELSITGKGAYDPAAGAPDFKGVLAGTQVSVNGKIVDTLTAAVTASAAEKSFKIGDIDGKVAGGSLQGAIVAHVDANPRYQADLSLNDAALARLMLPPSASDEDRKKIGTGRVSATLALQQTFGDANGKGAERTGRGDLIVRDGKIYNVPLAMGLMQLVTLRLPVAGSFDHATMSYYLRDNKVTFERILLESAGINLAGMGTMSLKTTPPTLDLNFITETPNEFYLPLISDFIAFTRKELLLQVEVTGPVNDPKITPVPLNPIAGTLKAILPHHAADTSK